jgi:hypothetical protein
MRPLISQFLDSKDPLERSRKLIALYKEMQDIID